MGGKSISIEYIIITHHVHKTLRVTVTAVTFCSHTSAVAGGRIETKNYDIMVNSQTVNVHQNNNNA